MLSYGPASNGKPHPRILRGALGADPEIAGVLRFQKAINAAASAVNQGPKAPAGGLFVRENHELAQKVARAVLHDFKLSAAVRAADPSGKLTEILAKVMTAKFEQIEEALQEEDDAAAAAGAYEAVAKMFGPGPVTGMSTGAKIAIGVGIVGVLGAGALLLMRRPGLGAVDREIEEGAYDAWQMEPWSTGYERFSRNRPVTPAEWRAWCRSHSRGKGHAVCKRYGLGRAK